MRHKPEVITLDNGLKAILLHSNESYSSTISMYTKYGSALENNDNSGIAHLIEHVAINTPKKWASKTELLHALEENGASKNGYTSREEVKFYINVPYTKVEFGLDIVNEVVFNATLDNQVILQEKNIILDEISKSKNDIQDCNYNYVMASLIKDETGYSKDIAGTKNTLMSLKQKDLINYYQKMNSPENLIFSISGNFDKPLIKSYIKKLEKIKNRNTVADFPKINFATNRAFFKNSKKTDLVFVNLTAPVKASNEFNLKELQMLRLFSTILCGPRSSRLMYRLRESENLLYDISLDVNLYKTFGFLNINYDVPTKLFEKTLNIVLEEVNDLLNNGITLKELNRMKEYISNRSFVYYDNVHNLIRLFDSQILDDREIIPLEDLIDALRKVNLDELNQFASSLDLINNSKILLYGNIKPDTKKIVESIKL